LDNCRTYEFYLARLGAEPQPILSIFINKVSKFGHQFAYTTAIFTHMNVNIFLKFCLEAKYLGTKENLGS